MRRAASVPTTVPRRCQLRVPLVPYIRPATVNRPERASERADMVPAKARERDSVALLVFGLNAGLHRVLCRLVVDQWGSAPLTCGTRESASATISATRVSDWRAGLGKRLAAFGQRRQREFNR
jgi:hypothetical protein